MEMSDEARKEDEFTGKIDALLSGKESKFNNSAEDKEYSSELDFAGKIKENRAEPSDVFKSRLRAKLLQKIAVKEIKPSFWERVWRKFSGPALRQAAVPIAIFLLAIVTMWGLGVFSPQTPVVITTPTIGATPGIIGTIPASTANLDISAGAQNTSYSSGQEIKLDITFRNNTNGTVNIGLFPPETSLVKQDNPAEIVRSFKAGKAILKLQSQETGTYTMTWDQLDNNGIQVSPGTYEIRINPSVYPENTAIDTSGLPLITIVNN
jgi:hypothetical protein